MSSNSVLRYEFAAVKAPTGLVFTSPRLLRSRRSPPLGDGEEVTVTITKRQDKRSLAANRALWGQD